MGILSHVVYTPPLTTVNAGAITAGLPGGMWRMVRDHRGERVGTTLGDWAVWAYLQASGVPNRLAIMTLEPWAVPAPFTTYGFGRSLPSGLYYVTDRIPREGSGLGYVLSVLITGAAPTLTVNFTDGSSTAVPIPQDLAAAVYGAGYWYYTYLDTTKAIASYTASGCSGGGIGVGLPEGVLVDPNPANWLSGYTPASVHPSTAQPPIFDGNDIGGHDGFVVASVFSVKDRDANANVAGHAALPRFGHNVNLALDTTGWYGPSWSSNNEYGFLRPIVLASDGSISEQQTGPSVWGARYFWDGAQGYLGSVFSAPLDLHIQVDGGDNYGSASRTITLTETNMDGTGGTVIYTESFSDTTGPNNYYRPLSIPLRPFKRYQFTFDPVQDRYGNVSPHIGGYIYPSWKHPLPFTVVASDGATIPGGVAAAHLATAEHPPTTTTTTTTGTVTAPGSFATSGWLATWQGLTPGLYQIVNNAAYGWVRDEGGGARMLNLGGGTTQVLAPGGTFSFATPVAPVAGVGTVTVSAISVTHSALALGANGVSGASAYAWRSFTAGPAGRYRFAISGAGAVDSALAFSTVDPLCCAGVLARIRAYNRRQPTVAGRQNAPPTSGTRQGLKVYLVGDAPTGAWAGHAGELAAALLGPTTTAADWQFWPLSPGDVIAAAGTTLAVDQRGTLVDTSVSPLAWADIDLLAGQTVYVRCGSTPDVRARYSGQHDTRESEYDTPAARGISITVTAA